MKNILVIAGHSACGCGQKEAVLTCELAKLVQTELQKIADANAALYDTNNNAYKTLRNGSSFVNYVLEIHFNALQTI